MSSDSKKAAAAEAAHNATTQEALAAQRVLDRPLETEMASLADRIIAALRERFADYGHAPSADHWKGLAAIARVIEQMALGTAPEVFSYSALPTGMGKTSTVVEAVWILTSDPAFADVGVIIFTNTLAQIPELVKAMDLKSSQFAVQVGQGRPENAMGRCAGVHKRDWPKERKLAQVLFVTQQKLPKLPWQMRSIAKLFPFRGEPRRVRVWDEAIMPSKPLTISVPDAHRFAGELDAHGFKNAARVLREWIESEVEGHQGVTRVPHLVMENSFAEVAAGDEDVWDAETPGSDLVALGDHDVRVGKDQYSGETIISYRDYLPKDFAPLLILDASGHLRLVYKLWGRGRGNMVQLPSPEKTYRNLTIRHWDRAAGKGTYRDSENQDDFADAVLRALQAVPAYEPLLVIYHMDGVTDPRQRPVPRERGRGRHSRAASSAVKDYANLKLRVEAKVRAWGGETAVGRLRFLHWGVHMASNQFHSIRHVIVVGLLQYDQPQNEAHYRAALGARALDEVSEAEVDALRLGEVSHHLFQGVGRGAIRSAEPMPDGTADVPEGCVLWVVFSTYRARMWVPRNLLTTVFPGATVERWEPLGVELRNARRKTNARLDFLETLLTRLGKQEVVSFEVWDLAPKGDHAGQQHAQKYLNDPAIIAALAEKGIALERTFEARRRSNVAVYTLRRGGGARGERQIRSRRPQRTADWLREQLAGGPLPVAELRKRAQVQGIDPRMLRLVRERAGVASEPSGASRRERVWRLRRPVAAE